jgi:hypothetical protein
LEPGWGSISIDPLRLNINPRPLWRGDEDSLSWQGRKELRMRILKIMILILPMLLLSSIIQADEDFIPIENTNQILGCWKRINFPEPVMEAMNKFELYPLKYQWYCFMDGGDLFSLHSSEDADYSVSELIEWSKRFPIVEEYSIPQAGLIFVYHRDAKQKTYWLSSLIARDWYLGGVQLIEGDLLMSIRDQTTGEDIYSRFLRRIW